MCALVIHHSLVVLGRLTVYHNKLLVFGFYFQTLLPNYLLYFAQDTPPTVCMGSCRWSAVMYHLCQLDTAACTMLYQQSNQHLGQQSFHPVLV